MVTSHNLDAHNETIAGKHEDVEDTHEKHEFVAGVLEEFMLQHGQKEGDIRQLKQGICEVVSYCIFSQPHKRVLKGNM